MNLHRAVIAVLQTLLFAGLAVAYTGAAGGLVRLLDARTVSLVILIGAGVTFIALVLYFGASDLELRRRFRRELTFR
jgi:hypothetical protein